MPFEAYLARPYEHRHELATFDALVQLLNARFASEPGFYLLVGNLMFSGTEADAVLFKDNGIVVIEMKSHGGRVEFNENAPWVVGGQKVVGGTKENPYLQLRTNRIALREHMKQRQAEFLRPMREVWWQDISAVVLFANPIQFDECILGDLRFWLHVTDLPRAADKLAFVRARNIKLDLEEVRRYLARLGVTANQCYKGTGTDIQTATPATEETPTVTRLVYVKELDIRQDELRMRRSPGARLQGALLFRELLKQARQGLDPFKELTGKPDSRINGAWIYRLNEQSELVLIHQGALAVPAFFGDPAEVQGWLTAHKDLVISIDEISGRVTITRISAEVNAQDLQPVEPTTENIPYLRRVPELNLEQLIPASLARKILLGLSEESSDDEILEALELAPSDDLRNYLFDIINLLRSGNVAAARERIALRNGKALPAEDAGAFAAVAADSKSNSDQLLVINELSQEKLDQLLDPEKFADWMLFLHPDQQAFVDADFEKPLVLKGISGSGKTCILVHRARQLARKYPGERIGVLTLSESLSGLLQHLVNALCSEEERKNIYVMPFYKAFQPCLLALRPDKYFAQLKDQINNEESKMHEVLDRLSASWPKGMVWDLDPCSNTKVSDEWLQFYMQRNPEALEWLNPITKYFESESIDAERYLDEELTLIRSSFAVPNRPEYLDTENRTIRAGRTTQIRKDMREDMLRVLLFWEEWLLAGGMIDALGLTQALLPLHAEMKELPDELKFRCLLIDEYQDFSSLDLQLLRRMAPLEKPNALFVAGDPVQKILVKRLRYVDAALDDGTATHKKIWKNYRNSKQILRAASKVANHFGSMATSQGEEIEVLDPELAQRETSPPVALKTNAQIEKAWEIAIECTRNDTRKRWTVCIATAAPQKISVEDILSLRPADLAAREIAGDAILYPEEVVVGTIADLKGFEFRLVIIVGCDENLLPYKLIPREETWREALRLYVAMTRARDQLFLLHEGAASEFLTVMGDTVIQREEPLLQPYERWQPPPPQPQPAQTRPTQPPPAGNRIHEVVQTLSDEGCAAWFSNIEIEALNKYFARYVYRDNLTFREWLKPRGLQMIRPKLFYSMHRCPPTVISGILTKLAFNGIKLPAENHRFY